MKCVDSNQVEWAKVSGHRQGVIQFKRLLAGVDDSLDNYELSLARFLGLYHTPRHRHNYDQIRYVMSGSVNYGEGFEVPAGAVGYFPEGTYYGPQNIVDDPVTLSLQFGGASGDGMLSYRQLEQGFESLRSLGEFQGGVFVRNEGDGKRKQDGYEAVWEHVTGRKLAYAKAQYERPIVMLPENYPLLQVDAAGSVRRALLGTFTARGTVLEYLSLAAGAEHDLAPVADLRLVFVISGAGRCEGHPWLGWSALEIGAGESTHWSVTEEARLLVITLPPVRTVSQWREAA